MVAEVSYVGHFGVKKYDIGFENIRFEDVNI